MEQTELSGNLSFAPVAAATNKIRKREGAKDPVIKEEEPEIMIVACFPPAKNINSYRPPFVSSYSPVHFPEPDISSRSLSSDISSYPYFSTQANEAKAVSAYNENYHYHRPILLEPTQHFHPTVFYQPRTYETYETFNSTTLASENAFHGEIVSQQSCPFSVTDSVNVNSTTVTANEDPNKSSPCLTLPRHVDIEFHRRLQEFVKKKKNSMVKLLTDAERPQLCTRITELEDEGAYGITPTLEFFTKSDTEERKKEFFENVRIGDLVIAEVIAKRIEGLALCLICYDGGKRGYLEDLNIEGCCSHDERIPANPNDLSQIYFEHDMVRCEVLRADLNKQSLSLGMKGSKLSPDVKLSFPLGLIADNDMPVQYLVFSRAGNRETSYQESLQRSNGFRSPGSIEFLGKSLGVFSTNHSLMTGLGLNYPKKDSADEIRKIQNIKWAETYVKLGKKQFLLGNHKEAFNCLTKAILHDNQNINYLILRGALHTVAGNFENATEDLENALSAKPEQTNMKKCIAESFLAVGKGFHSKGRTEEAINSYSKCMSILPDSSACSATLNILMAIQSQIDSLNITNISEAMTVKFTELQKKLKEMLADEIPKARTGYYDFVDEKLQSSSDNADGDSEANYTRNSRKRKYSSKSSSISSTSFSSSSESDSDESVGLTIPKRSKIKVLTNYQKIEEQVNAFLAKCDQGKPPSFVLDRANEEQTIDNVEREFNNYFVQKANLNSQHQTYPPCEPKSIEKVDLPCKIELRMDKYGNYLPPKSKKIFKYEIQKDPTNIRPQNGFDSDPITVKSYCFLKEEQIKVKEEYVKVELEEQLKKKECDQCDSDCRSDSHDTETGTKSSSRSRTCSASSSRHNGHSSNKSSRSGSHSQSKKSLRGRTYEADSHSEFRRRSRYEISESRKRNSSSVKSWSKYSTKPVPCKQSLKFFKNNLSPSDPNYVSPNYLGKRPIQGYHLLPPEEFRVVKLARNPISFQFRSNTRPKRLQGMNAAFSRPSSSASSRSCSPSLTCISANTDASAYSDQ